MLSDSRRRQSLFSRGTVSQEPCNMTGSGEGESARGCMLFDPACLRRLVSRDTDLRDMKYGTQNEKALVFHIGWRCDPMANKPPKHIIAVMVWCVLLGRERINKPGLLSAPMVGSGRSSSLPPASRAKLIGAQRDVCHSWCA
jgi:hypothetical protein